MKRYIPGLHSRQQDHENLLKACSSFESMPLLIAGIRKSRFCPSGLSFLSPKRLPKDHSPAGCIARNGRCGN